MKYRNERIESRMLIPFVMEPLNKKYQVSRYTNDSVTMLIREYIKLYVT